MQRRIIGRRVAAVVVVGDSVAAWRWAERWHGNQPALWRQPSRFCRGGTPRSLAAARARGSRRHSPMARTGMVTSDALRIAGLQQQAPRLQRCTLTRLARRRPTGALRHSIWRMLNNRHAAICCLA